MEKKNNWADLQDCVKMAATSENKSLFVVGEGGMGKTEVVLRTLEELNIPHQHFMTFSTPLELYSYLYLHKDELIVMDDMEGVLDNKKSIAILKSCLWGYKGKREVQYLSSTDRLMVPPKFEFTGRAIVLLNEYPKNKFVKSLITRSVYYEMKVPFSQKVEMMEDIARQEHPGMSLEERMLVFKFIRDHSTEATKEFNFRTLIKAFNIYLANKARWKDLVKLMLQPDEDLATLRSIEEATKGLPVNNLARLFTQETGKSRSTFFRLRRRLREG